MACAIEASNGCDLLFFSDQCRVYKAKASDFSDTKASVLGDYIPAKLGMEEGEQAVSMVVTKDYQGYLLFFFENGKLAKVPMEAYATKTNRRKLTGAYSDRSPLVCALHILEDGEFLLTSSTGRMLLVHTGTVSAKTTRSTQGVAVMTLKKGVLQKVVPYEEGTLQKPNRYRTKTLPAAGMMPAPEDRPKE